MKTRIRFPVQFTLDPESVESGTHWVTINLRNLGGETLRSLDVRLNSMDTYSVKVLGSGEFVLRLAPEEETTLAFQVNASSTASLYVTVDGLKAGNPFHISSPLMRLRVTPEVAELAGVFALTEPYAAADETLRVEATVLGIEDASGLELEFWADRPNGDFEELGMIQVDSLQEGEYARYGIEVTPSEAGIYTIYAYLYHGMKRIGYGIDTLMVE